MRILALDVDGVLLDADRAGLGHWTTELHRRFGIERAELRAALFEPSWPDVIVGRRDLRDALDEALSAIGTPASVDDVLDCWLESDFVLVDGTVDLARRACAAGIPVVLATNQEHWRAAFLKDRVGALFPLHDVLYSADLGVTKDQPAFFDAASARLAVDVRREVVFADDADENVRAARSAGWSAHLATPTNGWVEAVASELGLP